MSQIANVVAFDGAAPPVSHTFTPIGIAREKTRLIAKWRETSLASLPVYAQPRLTAYIDDRSNNGVYRVGLLLEIPVMENVLNQNAAGYTSPPKVAHVVTMFTEGRFHERSDTVIRRLARKLQTNILDGIVVTSAAGITGPTPELFDSLTMPT